MKGHLLQSADEPSHEFIVAEKSPRRVCEGGRDAAGDTGDGDVRPKAGDKFCQKVNVLLRSGTEEIPGPFFVFSLHGGSSEDLELVELEIVKREGIQDLRFLKQHLTCFSGKTDDDVTADGKPSCARLPDGVPGAGEIVPPVDLKAVKWISDIAEGTPEFTFVPVVFEPGVFPDHVFAGAEHCEEPSAERLAKDFAPFGVLPLAAAQTAPCRLGILSESLFNPPQPKKPHGQFLVRLAQPDDILSLMDAVVADAVGHATDDLQLGMDIVAYFGGNHPDLVLFSPGHKLIRFCHNKMYFKELHRPPGPSHQGTILPGRGPSSGVVEIHACYDLWNVQVRIDTASARKVMQ